MLSLMIDTKEGRDVATADVEGAYLHADMEDFVILKLAGEAVDIMCQVNPKYKKFVVVNLPGNGALFPFDLTVCHAQVIRSQFKTHVDQSTGEQLVP